MGRAIHGVRVNPVVESTGRTVICAAGEWSGRLDARNVGMAEGWAQRPIEAEFSLSIPGCVQSLDSLADKYPPARGLRNTYLGTFWLERWVDIPEVPAGKMVWLKFGGISPAAHIWLNGEYIGYHSSPQVSVKWDVTKHVMGGASNRITVVIVEQDTGMLAGVRFCGLDWSGLYRSVELEISSEVHIEDLAIRPEIASNKVTVLGVIYNETGSPMRVAPQCRVATWPLSEVVAEAEGQPVDVGPLSSCQFSLSVDARDIKFWTCDNPVLHSASVSLLSEGQVMDECADRFGMREFGAKGTGLHLNGRPFMARGAGLEYFSPTISPLVDKAIIRNRLKSFVDHGFNFYRYHTSFPTDEELDVADEMGVLISSETPIVTNMGWVRPVDRAFQMLRDHVVQTRNHPSLGVYCLGNEGSQLMVKSQEDCENARIGYSIVKQNSPAHAVMVVFGIQGEMPDVPNDIESPHLWSHQFWWAYDGLSRVPWRLLWPLTKKRPCIVHEYGKYGVWPDPAEEALYPANGFRATFGQSGRAALVAAGLGDIEDQVIANSRKLSLICNRLAIEQARRQPAIDGYAVWKFFRHGRFNSGIADDMGHGSDHDPALFREGCNAPLAVLMDRDYEGRNLCWGEFASIGLHLSNFGDIDLEGAEISWQLKTSDAVIADGVISGVCLRSGRNAQVGRIECRVDGGRTPAHAVLRAIVRVDGAAISTNSWDFWVFPVERFEAERTIVYDFSDEEFARRFRDLIPQAISITDADSMIRGCRSWTGTDIAQVMSGDQIDIVISDHLGETVERALEHGKTVVLLDSGKFPRDWYPAMLPAKNDDPALDLSKFYPSFRSGWGEGNIATIVAADPMLGDFPHTGFCDLQFYGMIQGSRPVRTAMVKSTVGSTGSKVLIRSIPKLNARQASEIVVQDPNARVQRLVNEDAWATEDRSYIAELQVPSGRLLIYTLRPFDDPAGRYLLKQILMSLT